VRTLLSSHEAPNLRPISVAPSQTLTRCRRCNVIPGVTSDGNGASALTGRKGKHRQSSKVCFRGIARRESDLAIRFARPAASELVCRKLGEVGFSLYASQRYLAKFGIPKRGQGLGGYDLITFTGAPAATTPFFMGESLDGARVAVRCDHHPAQGRRQRGCHHRARLLSRRFLS
jgi:hypothetical protein